MKNTKNARSAKSIACAFTLAAALAVGAIAVAPSIARADDAVITPQVQTAKVTGSTAKKTNGYIGDAEAMRIALKDAGVSQENCTELECELDLDDGTIHYDVDFQSKGVEYDYDINATTGAIIYHHAEIDD